MDLFFENHTRVATYDVDPFGEIRPSAVLNYFQEISGLHSKLAQVSVFDMFKAGKTWVITRYHVKLLHRPKAGDELIVRTWPSSRGEIFVTRDFSLEKSDGTEVALATVSYALIDIKARKPVPIADAVPDGYVLDKRAVMDTFEPLPVPKKISRGVQLPVMLRDLDVNGHVNHVVYVSWGLEAVPVSVWEAYRPASIEIAYRAETRYGDSVISRISDPGVQTTPEGLPVIEHQIVNAATGVELARLRTTWTKIRD